MTKINLPDFATPAPEPSADDRAFLDAAMLAALQGMLTGYWSDPSACGVSPQAFASAAVEQARALLRARKGDA